METMNISVNNKTATFTVPVEMLPAYIQAIMKANTKPVEQTEVKQKRKRGRPKKTAENDRLANIIDSYNVDDKFAKALMQEIKNFRSTSNSSLSVPQKAEIFIRNNIGKEPAEDLAKEFSVSKYMIYDATKAIRNKMGLVNPRT